MELMSYHEKQRMVKYSEYLGSRIESLTECDVCRWRSVRRRRLTYTSAHDTKKKQLNTQYQIVMEQGNKQQIFLEEKLVYGDIIKKEAVRLREEQCRELVQGNIKWLMQEESPLMSRFYFQLEINKIKPREMTECIREVYENDTEEGYTVYEVAEQLSPEKPERFLEDELLLEERQETGRVRKIVRTPAELPFYVKELCGSACIA